MSSVIAQFAGADPISIGNCLAIFADGGWAKPVVADFPLLIEVSPTSGAITFSQAEKTQVLRLLMLAEREDHVADTLRFLYRGTWFDLYFACEVMADDCGGQHELMKRRWAKEHELELVRQNANLYRHARPKCRPSRLLSLEEARGLLERAIWGWLAEKS
jgi:hypothetical protein